MTPSPFSNVVAHDQNSSTFVDVESTQVSDTTDDDNVATRDDGTESSLGVEVTQDHITHEAAQDETAGQSDLSGTPNP